MKCSLIITTYNWKEALELVLLSVLQQMKMPDEVVIADDGSDKETRLLIEKYINIFPIPLIHSWQEDLGFRAARSRNLAISKSSMEYIILIDGDMILHSAFIKDHLLFARKGYFIQGGRVLIGESKTAEFLTNKKFNISFMDSDIKNRKNMIHSQFLSTIFSKPSNKLSGIKTCNMAFYKNDCYLINGFDNNFIGWGREDSEFVIRLMNSGIKRLNLKFMAIAYHLWHNENERASLDSNDLRLKKSLEKKLLICENGITQLSQ